jgi:Putative metal-binding motif/FG-GAP repeat
VRRLLFALAVACNGDKAGPIAELEVEEQCVEHPSPLLPREDESGDTGDVAGIWDTDDDGDGWTLGDGDCDDGDPDVHPGFAEVAGNGLDEDCDGSEAGPTRRLGEAEWRWQWKNGNEGGFKIAFAGDTNGDGREEALVGVPDQGVVNDWDDYNDRVFLVNLSGDGSAEPIATVNPEESNGQNGRGTLLGANDLDGDGFDDVVVGIPWSTGPDGAAQDAYAGELLVYFGPVSGLLTESLADGRIRANLRSMHLGYSAALHPGTHDSEWMDLW